LNRKEKDKLMLKSVGFGTGYFLITTIIAMITYPGGYDFLNNFFSHLGTMFALNGSPNLISRILFSSSVFLAGASLIPYFVTVTKFFKEGKVERIISLIITIPAIIAALAYIGIGFTPADLSVTSASLHGTFVRISFLLTLFVIAIYTILFFLKKGIPRYLCYVGLFFTVVSLLYVFTLFGIIKIQNPDGVNIDAVFQKIIIYTEMISMLIIGPGMAKYADKIKFDYEER